MKKMSAKSAAKVRKNIINQASEHLKDLQRDGLNATIFKSLVGLLPNPNDASVWEQPDLLHKVQHQAVA